MFSRARSLLSITIKSTKFLLHKPLRSSLVPSFIYTHSLLQKPVRHFSGDGYLRDYSDYTLAQQTLRNYVSTKSPVPELAVKFLHELEKFKIGIVSSESIYKDFIFLLTKAVKNNATPQELDAITESASNIHIKTPSFWKAVHEVFNASKDKIDTATWTSLAHTFIRLEAYSAFNDEIQRDLEKYRTKIESSLVKLSLKHTIRGLYVYAYFQEAFPALVHKLKQDLMDNIPQLDMLLSADDLATASFLTLYLVPEGDPDKSRIMRDLSGHFISRDLLEYDLTLQHYEYDDPTPGETGIKDRLRWSSIALMARVFSTPEYYDDNLLGRLKQAIYRKSESDLVDFESAAIILSVVVRAEMFKDNDFVMRIMEMLNWQFQSEGKELAGQFDTYTIALYLDALINLNNPEIDPNLINGSFGYFGTGIINGEIVLKDNKEELEALLRGFKEGTRISRFDRSVLDFLEEKIRNC